MCGTSAAHRLLTVQMTAFDCSPGEKSIGKGQKPDVEPLTASQRRRPAGQQSKSTLALPSCRDLAVVARRKPDDYYCDKDMTRTIEAVCSLHEGCFYHPDVCSAQAKQILRSCDVGTFIVRDSSDPRYLFTISVSTRRGPTSIRIIYERGYFSLDSDEKSKKHIPKFTAVLELIDFYIRQSAAKKSEKCKFLDTKGKKDLPIILSKPKLCGVPSLKHLARTAINRALKSNCTEVSKDVETLPLPKILRSYIKDYPFVY